MGPAGALTGPDFAISDALGQTRGNNLFHSFSQFGLAAGESATFSGPAEIQNVIARVTGGSASTIDGALNCDIAGANFFFINPFGVIFGPNAQVNVSGAFAATTADYVRLADGGRFDARTPANDVLTTAPVSAFGFLGASAGGIQIQQAALIFPGQTATFIGGAITMESGYVAAPAGRLNLISTAGAGELTLDPTDPAAEVDTGSFAALGLIQLLAGSVADASADGSGWLTLEAGAISLSESAVITSGEGEAPNQGIHLTARDSITLDNSVVAAYANGSADGGDLELRAARLILQNASSLITASADIGSGGAGAVVIRAGTVVLDEFSEISTTTASASSGGAVDITSDSLTLAGSSRIWSSSIVGASGDPGDLQIRTDQLWLAGGQLNTTSEGAAPGGDIHITARDVVITGQLPLSFISTEGNLGGNITIDATTIELADHGRISVSAVTMAGTIQLSATDSLKLTGQATIRATAETTGGNISVTAGREIRLTDARITAVAEGDGGNITLTAPRLIYLNGSTVSAASTAGNGGNVVIDPLFTVLLNSQVLANAILGNGGNIDITTGYFLRLDSLVDASSQFGLQGSVTINAPRFDLTEATPTLPAELLDAESQLQPHCAVRLPAGVSTFITTGRGATAYRPDDLQTVITPRD